jgi:signal transduction histidine kinase
VINTQKSQNIEFEYKDNNQLKYFEARFLYFTEDKIMVLIRDITDRKNAELLEKQELKRLQEIDKIKNDLITRISHELKTPLTSIFAALEFVQEVYKEDLNEEIRNLINIINRGSNRLKSLIDDLMEIYHIELNSLKLNMETTDIVPTIKKSIANAQGIINKREQQINVSLPDKKILKFDKEKMETVITNLISNAAKNTPQKGSIFVSVEEDDEWVEIKVRDTGVGFTEEEKNKIFKKFGKIERYGQNFDVNIDGPGLGLYLAREIVRLHNGEIKLFSEGRNKGSTFVIRLKNVWLNSFFNYI